MGYKHEGKDRDLDRINGILDIIAATKEPITRDQIEEQIKGRSETNLGIIGSEPITIITTVLNHHPLIQDASPCTIQRIGVDAKGVRVTPATGTPIQEHCVSVYEYFGDLKKFISSPQYPTLLKHNIIGIYVTPTLPAEEILKNYLKALSHIAPWVESNRKIWFDSIKDHPFFIAN